MHLFPVNNVGSDNSQIQTTLTANNEQQKKNVDDKKTTISIFSHYDTGKDGNVDAKEAKSFNLFGTISSSSMNSLGSSKGKFSDFGDKANEAKQKIQSDALNKLEGKSLQGAFDKLIGNWKGVSGLKESFTYSGSDAKESKQNKIAAGLDSKVTESAKPAGDKAIQDVISQYQAALDEAFESYKSSVDKDAESNGDEDLSSKLSIGDENAKNKQTELQTTVTSKEIEAYATKDTDQNEKVQGKKGEVGNSDFSFNISNITAKRMDSEVGNMSSIVRQEASKTFDAQSMYDKLVKSFSVDTGSLKTTVTNEKGVTQSDIDNATNDFTSTADQKVTTEINAMQNNVTQIQNEYQNAVDAAYDKFIKSSDEDKAKLGYDENATQDTSDVSETPEEPAETTPEVKKKNGNAALTGTGNGNGGSSSSIGNSIVNALGNAATKAATTSSSSSTETTVEVTGHAGDKVRKLAKQYDVKKSDLRSALVDNDTRLTKRGQLIDNATVTVKKKS